MKTKLLFIIFFTSLSFMSQAQSVQSQVIETIHKEKLQTEILENSPTDGRISLRLAGNGLYATILIGFIPEGTENFDDGFDGPFINEGAAIEFYSFLNTMKLSIQALPELTTTNMQVPLGYELTSAGSYTISIDAEFLSPNFDIILEDTQANIFTDLRQTGYTFSGTVGETHNRFFLNLDYINTLHIKDEAKTTSDVYAYFSSNLLKFETLRTDIQTIALFDFSGKQILSAKFDAEIDTKNIVKGMYIVQYQTTSGERINRKIIK